MRIYISQEKNRKTETLAQVAIRMNGIRASLTHADYEGPILVNQRLRTRLKFVFNFGSSRVLLGLMMEKANI
jgi:hypothetical protein